MMISKIRVLLIGFAVFAGPLTPVPASADNYRICYDKIKAQFGPYTDITWMERVWKCSADLDAKGPATRVDAKKTKPTGECNFDKPVGSCKGHIQLQSASGSKGNYSAEVLVTSSAPSCSKVEFYVDNTPYQTVFKNSSSQDESVFGTSPISKKSFDIDKCTTYANRD